MYKPTILVTAYTVDPYKGSEAGMGWNMILQIARYQQVIAITRENNKDNIDRYLKENSVTESSNIQFEYFDLPYYLRFWKKGGRAALLYFYIWQFCIAGWIKKKNWQYDIVHNLNFHNDWTPTFLWRSGMPLVWGPIGHHPMIPDAFLKPYGFSNFWREKLKWMAKQLFWRFDPFLKIAKNNASHIFAMNSTVTKVLTLPEAKTTILPSVASENPPEFIKYPKDNFNVLSVGRFVALKGFDVTIRVFAAFVDSLPESDKKKVKLTLVGQGSKEKLLKQIIAEAGMQRYVHIIPWIERDKLGFIYQASDVFLFPSHEGAGMVVAEAMSYGLPVLCFDNSGPGEFINNTCGHKIPYQKYDAAIYWFSKELFKMYNDREYIHQLSNGAVRQFNSRFTWDTKGEIFKMVYEAILKENDKLVENESNKENHIYSSL